MKAHSKTEPRAEWNQQADQLAKEGARTSVAWDPYEECRVAAVSGQPEEKGVVLSPDLGTVQAQDPILKATLAAICRQEKIEGPYEAADIIVREGMLFEGDKWVVPFLCHKEFLQPAHESPGAGHPGPETTGISTSQKPPGSEWKWWDGGQVSGKTSAIFVQAA
ncbi:hypothetical protein scyTo_0017308 [Scyliorhinus torazame]|uniref:Uncharacterized protein n=1 Tax=Scyliorhinus torazame TaxID=75743 RepID=A0A401PPY9_SCYTO|nr:hypothetical protein [Scyliorhinus torazame]